MSGGLCVYCLRYRRCYHLSQCSCFGSVTIPIVMAIVYRLFLRLSYLNFSSFDIQPHSFLCEKTYLRWNLCHACRAVPGCRCITKTLCAVYRANHDHTRIFLAAAARASVNQSPTTDRSAIFVHVT